MLRYSCSLLVSFSTYDHSMCWFMHALLACVASQCIAGAGTRCRERGGRGGKVRRWGKHNMVSVPDVEAC